VTNVQLPDGGAVATLLGTGREAGADEDDFHMIRRRNLEIDRDERAEGKAPRAGSVAGVVEAPSVKPKKVVYF
jgi:zinc finger CCHC domain-containing protein 9